MVLGLFQNPSDDVEPVGAAVESTFRFGAAFLWQRRHAFGVDIGRIRYDQVITFTGERAEQVALMQSNAVLEPVVGNVAFGNRERILPAARRGFYREYTVRTPGVRNRGARRIVCGGEPGKAEPCYYTDDHYKSFKCIQR